MSQSDKNSPMICYCNGIRRKAIEESIKNGATTVDEIYDQTMAGVGPCGGSCRPFIKEMLDHYLKHGHFLDIKRS